MWNNVLFLCIIASLTGSSQQTCQSIFEDVCSGTVECNIHAGRADYLPQCHDTMRDTLEFIIKDSMQISLEVHFFGSTNFDSRVKKFNGKHNSWANIGANAFKYYINCIEMDLSFNDILTIEEGAFAQLGRMTHMNLSHNIIEQLETDFLLVSYDYYSEIKVLDLSHNRLTAIETNVFNEAPKLQQLYLNDNNIISLSQNVFSGVNNLIELYLNNNKLVTLTFVTNSLRTLNKLDLSFNKLSQILSNDTTKLLMLQHVNMSYNYIELVESNSFSRAFDLEIVDLSNNIIKTNIETTLFINNNKLRYLDLTNNSIRSIQENSFQHNCLDYLKLDQNILYGDVKVNMFAGLNLITSFNLSHQNITAIRANAFKDMSSLKRLNLCNNQITIIDEASFTNADSLQNLNLSYNKITNLTFLQNVLSNLTQLDLSNNFLTIISSGAFVNQISLILLDLSQNNIFNVEQNSLPLKKLQYLFIKGNKLNGTISKDTFSPALYLRRLDLSNFRIKNVENESFTDMPVLSNLDLSMNEIEFLDSNNFYGMNNMYSLNISYNKLSYLMLNHSNIFQINGLYLQHNYLTSLSFHNMSQLTFLDLSQNNIADVADIFFDTLPIIKVLLLSNNKLSYFNSNKTNSFKNLTTLDLSNNQIKVIDMSFYKEIEQINLCHNRLDHMTNEFFQNLAKIQLLDLSHNEINKIAPGTFKTAKSMRALNLSSNALTELRYGIFHGLTQLHSLDLSRNNLTDFEVDIFHECPKLHALILDYNNLTHIDVSRLANIAPALHKLSIGGNHLPCRDIVNYIKNIDQTFTRQMEITSIVTVHHDDNVNGIKCGVKSVNNTDVVDNSADVGDNKNDGVGIILTWCFLILILFIVLGVVSYFYLYKKVRNNFEPSNEIFLNVDHQRDLLS